MTYEQIETRREDLDAKVSTALVDFQTAQACRKEMAQLAVALSEANEESLSSFIEEPKKNGKHLFMRAAQMLTPKGDMTGVGTMFKNLYRAIKDLVFTGMLDDMRVQGWLNLLRSEGIDINISIQNPNSPEQTQAIQSVLQTMIEKNVAANVAQKGVNTVATEAKEVLNLSKNNFMTATKLSFKKSQGHTIQEDCDKKISMLEETEGILNYVQYAQEVTF